MRRFILNVLTAVSFLLLAVTVICWIKSLWIEEVIFVNDASQSLVAMTSIVSRQGIVEVAGPGELPEEIDWWINVQAIDAAYLAMVPKATRPPPDGEFAGFAWGTYEFWDGTSERVGRYIEVPFWAPALLWGLLPGWRLACFGWRWRSMRRAAGEKVGLWRRLIRGAFAAATAFSFAVMLVAAFFWARSCWISDAVFMDGSLVSGRALSISGSIIAELNAPGDSSGDWNALSERGNYLGMTPAQFLADRIPTSNYWQGFGFGSWSEGGARETIVIFPDAFLVLILAILPVWWLLRFRQRYLRVTRLAAGHCPACGYDLQGAVSRTCPECGAGAG